MRHALRSTVLRANNAYFSSAPALKHRPTMPFESSRVQMTPNVFVAPSATVIGDVVIGDSSSIMYNAVIRGDLNKVKIGVGVTVGERATIGTVPSLQSGFPAECILQNNVTIGAGSSLRSCIIMEDAIIGENTVISEVTTTPCI